MVDSANVCEHSCSMDETLTPLGELIETARARTKLSQNAAAERAGTSGTTWRRVVKGLARFGGHDVPHDGAADTVARMARIVGLTPEQLEEHGRPDAAAELRDILRAVAAASEPSVADLAERLTELERANAEQARVNAETARVNEETRRQLEETARRNAELAQLIRDRMTPAEKRRYSPDNTQRNRDTG